MQVFVIASPPSFQLRPAGAARAIATIVHERRKIFLRIIILATSVELFVDVRAESKYSCCAAELRRNDEGILASCRRN